ncbi:hypothetical protein AVEN_252957-1 [Araneus ventricosus]|uniref:Uncharacterized protein n=1 Tax=Araneus ventricosus TaxID=182803 RepID=A0A4Y2UZD1_ARAVE|nr:hypothetical protein AVEN_252957-1 [Araneus ventricosus]
MFRQDSIGSIRAKPEFEKIINIERSVRPAFSVNPGLLSLLPFRQFLDRLGCVKLWEQCSEQIDRASIQSNQVAKKVIINIKFQDVPKHVLAIPLRRFLNLVRFDGSRFFVPRLDVTSETFRIDVPVSSMGRGSWVKPGCEETVIV